MEVFDPSQGPEDKYPIPTLEPPAKRPALVDWVTLMSKHGLKPAFSKQEDEGTLQQGRSIGPRLKAESRLFYIN
jgi:hypothetical protein